MSKMTSYISPALLHRTTYLTLSRARSIKSLGLLPPVGSQMLRQRQEHVSCYICPRLSASAASIGSGELQLIIIDGEKKADDVCMK